LSGNPELDENALRSLRALLGEIQVAIDRAAGEVPQTDHTLATSLPIGQRLQSVIGEFEAHHPRLTMTLSQIADRLTAMGI
jgi:DNA-binding transcriptional LysR family regulator